MLGDSEENLTGTLMMDFIDTSLEEKRSASGVHAGPKDVQSEVTLVSRHGINIPVLYTQSVIADIGGNITGYVSVFHNLTEQKNIERQIGQIRRERAIAIHDAQEKERLRIATDLHDGIVQMLTSVSYSIQNLESEILSEADNVKTEIARANEQVNTAIVECRRISHNLIPLALHDFGLVPAISHLIARVSQENAIRLHFDSFNMEKRTDARIEKVLYRICQESITNILKHSKATEAYVQLIRHDETIVLIVEDNGIGFNVNSPAKDRNGIGLETIRTRVDDFGGNLTIQSSEQNGTELIIEIPCINSRS